MDYRNGGASIPRTHTLLSCTLAAADREIEREPLSRMQRAIRYRSVVHGLLILSVRKLRVRFRRPVYPQSRASRDSQPRVPRAACRKGSAPAVAAVSGVSERRLSALHWLRRLRKKLRNTPLTQWTRPKPLLNQAIGLGEDRLEYKSGSLGVAALECERKKQTLASVEQALCALSGAMCAALLRR